MAGWWPAVSRAARRHPWPTNVLLYGSLFSAGDALQQRLQGGEADWRQTRRVATLVVTFHANFNYVWLGLLERALPGRAPRAVLAKLLWDQVVGAPIAVSAFYTEWTGVLALCTADQLQPCSCSVENSLHWSSRRFSGPSSSVFQQSGTHTVSFHHFSYKAGLSAIGPRRNEKSRTLSKGPCLT
ncbi:mpv17-like protein [Papio anubis]|uniref:mpv17-like protein n=1 Tax=Papio anubis TaxID=9555 RepID=UPI0012AE40B9|nr:mpv17-like protein [Papio anubis]